VVESRNITQKEVNIFQDLNLTHYLILNFHIAHSYINKDPLELDEQKFFFGMSYKTKEFMRITLRKQ
jgi:hypothetical protein